MGLAGRLLYQSSSISTFGVFYFGQTPLRPMRIDSPCWLFAVFIRERVSTLYSGLRHNCAMRYLRLRFELWETARNIENCNGSVATCTSMGLCIGSAICRSPDSLRNITAR